MFKFDEICELIKLVAATGVAALDSPAFTAPAAAMSAANVASERLFLMDGIRMVCWFSSCRCRSLASLSHSACNSFVTLANLPLSNCDNFVTFGSIR